jgi:hypothetical protein
MLDLISEKILEHLNKNGLDVQDIDFKQLVDRQTGSIMRPKVNVSIDSGTHKKVTMTTYKQIPVISLFIVVQNLGGEKKARFASYKLLDAIVDNLLITDLGLPLQDKLTPLNFQNITDEAYAGAGFSLYQIDFSCSFNYTADPEDSVDEGELLKIVNTYYVDNSETMVSEVNVSDVDSGGAYSRHIEKISGGLAGTKDYIEDITGGNAINAP